MDLRRYTLRRHLPRLLRVDLPRCSVDTTPEDTARRVAQAWAAPPWDVAVSRPAIHLAAVAAFLTANSVFDYKLKGASKIEAPRTWRSVPESDDDHSRVADDHVPIT